MPTSEAPASSIPIPAPEKIALLGTSGKVVRQADGSLTLFYLAEGPPTHFNTLCRRNSRDHGRTWTDPEPLITLPEDKGLWGGLEALAGADGEAHVWFIHDRGSGVLGASPLGEGEKALMKTQGQILDIWHLKSADKQTRWPMPKRIWEGYTGSFNSVMQMSSGRIVLPFSWLTNRSWYNRGEGLDAFTYHGNFTSTVLCSDDQGATWFQGTKDIKVWAFEAAYAYGSCEPVVIERTDGSAWMLIRTQTGRFYESVSPDGAEWSIPRPTPIISSDSPAGLVRMLDGRMVMIWNQCLRYPYAFGGRQVIHAAVSHDDGRTWLGARECARDPRRHEPPPNGGDFGTAYPFPTVTADNHVAYVTGQGQGRVLLMRMSPDWLEATHAACDMADPEEIQVFGTKGVGLAPAPGLAGKNALRLTKELPGATAGAVWNFPLAAKGRARVKAKFEKGCRAIRLSLADHFSTPFDIEDDLFAVFNLVLGDNATLAGPLDAKGLRLDDAQWHTIDFEWDTIAARRCLVRVDGQGEVALPLLHQTAGVNYLRFVSLAPEADPAGAWFTEIEAWVDR
ncbi:MAG: sialidase family protein [Planctomycetota bacterium]|nr:sialidase family protein [Planctomycetota bacterium]